MSTEPKSPTWALLTHLGLLWFCCVVAFSSSLHGSFVFDDGNAIIENGTIRNLYDWTQVLLSPPRGGSTTDARPLINLSMAINYSMGGLEPFGYHVFNIAIHLLNVTLVFLLLRTLMESMAAPVYLRERAQMWAFLSTLIWCVHPIQASVVSYISQRAESMAGLFYLLVLVLDLRCSRGSPWRNLTLVAVMVGGLCKETMITVPVVSAVLLRWQSQQSWREFWIANRRDTILKYFALIPMVLLAVLHGGRSGTAVRGEVSTSEYLLAQGFVIPRYLYSMVNPTATCVDYGIYPPASGWLPATGLLILTLMFLWSAFSVLKGGSGGVPLFCAAVFLAPSSSILPIITQVGGEHRVYLPSIAIAVYVVTAIAFLTPQANVKPVVVGTALSAALILGGLTFVANSSFASLETFWERAVQMTPYNLRARQNLAAIAMRNDRPERARDLLAPLFEDKCQRIPALVEFADVLERRGDYEHSQKLLNEVLATDSSNLTAMVLLTRLYTSTAQYPLAIAQAEKAIEVEPKRSDAWSELGRALRLLAASQSGSNEPNERARELEEKAEFALRRSIALAPWTVESRITLSGLLIDQQRDEEAQAELRSCLIYEFNRAEVWYWIAFLHAQHKNRHLALNAVNEAIRWGETPEAIALKQFVERLR